MVVGVAGQHGQAGGGRGQVALYQVVGHLRVISFRVRVPWNKLYGIVYIYIVYERVVAE